MVSVRMMLSSIPQSLGCNFKIQWIDVNKQPSVKEGKEAAGCYFALETTNGNSVKIKKIWLICLVSFCMPTKIETWEFLKIYQTFNSQFVFSKAMYNMWPYFTAYLLYFYECLFKISVCHSCGSLEIWQLCSNTACTLFLFTAEPQKKMFIIDTQWHTVATSLFYFAWVIYTLYYFLLFV